MARIGRNDPCPCGSGRKYKKCCSPKFDPPPAVPEAPRDVDVGHWEAILPTDTREYDEAAQWPLERMWVPRPEIWAATGVGVLAALRSSPQGASAYSITSIELCDGGVKACAAKVNITRDEAQDAIDSITEQMGPRELGDPAVAAALLRATVEQGRAWGSPLPPTATPFLKVLTGPSPAPRARTLRELAGRNGFHPRALLEVVEAHRPFRDVEDGAEVAILTSAGFTLEDPVGALKSITARRPDFDLREQGEVVVFDFTREERPGQKAPQSRIPGRRVQGKVTIKGNRLSAIGGSLSMTAYMLNKLLDALEPRPRLEVVQWFSPNLKRTWAWSAEDEPLALHGKNLLT